MFSNRNPDARYYVGPKLIFDERQAYLDNLKPEYGGTPYPEPVKPEPVKGWCRYRNVFFCLGLWIILLCGVIHRKQKQSSRCYADLAYAPSASARDLSVLYGTRVMPKRLLPPFDGSYLTETVRGMLEYNLLHDDDQLTIFIDEDDLCGDDSPGMNDEAAIGEEGYEIMNSFISVTITNPTRNTQRHRHCIQRDFSPILSHLMNDVHSSDKNIIRIVEMEMSQRKADIRAFPTDAKTKAESMMTIDFISVMNHLLADDRRPDWIVWVEDDIVFQRDPLPLMMEARERGFPIFAGHSVINDPVYDYGTLFVGFDRPALEAFLPKVTSLIGHYPLDHALKLLRQNSILSCVPTCIKHAPQDVYVTSTIRGNEGMRPYRETFSIDFGMHSYPFGGGITFNLGGIWNLLSYTYKNAANHVLHHMGPLIPRSWGVFWGETHWDEIAEANLAHCDRMKELRSRDT